MEAIEEAGNLRRRNAGARIDDAHAGARTIRLGVHVHADAAFERELERIRQQVEQDRFPQRRIDVDGRRQRLRRDVERQPRAFGCGAEHRRDVCGHRGQIQRLEDGVRAARLHARELEQRIDEAQQP